MMLQMVDFTYSTDLFLVADQRPYTWKTLEKLTLHKHPSLANPASG